MDDGGGWRPARLTPEQMEERRLAAAALLRQGRLSQAAIARRLGVSGAGVCRWAATLAQDGRRGLLARAADRPAGAPRCTGPGAPGPVVGAGGGGGRLRDRAMDPAAHRGADPARARGGPSSALPGAAAEGARLLGATPGHPGAGA